MTMITKQSLLIALVTGHGNWIITW